MMILKDEEVLLVMRYARLVYVLQPNVEGAMLVYVLRPNVGGAMKLYCDRMEEER